MPYEEKKQEDNFKLIKILTSIDFSKKVGHKLNSSELGELCKLLKYCFRKKGDKVCTAGEADGRFYILLRGKVMLSHR
jgi:hypothetical protein